MFPYTFEVVTALTMTVIGIILVLYFQVLKRKGWLTKNSNESNESFYRCPNQECRKIFEKPIGLKDLSETPARVYPACPHCGLDLEAVSAFRAKKKPRMSVKIPLLPKKPETTIEGPFTGVRTLKPETVGLMEIPEMPETLPEESLEPVEAQKPKTAPPKHAEARPPECTTVLDEIQETPTRPYEPREEPTVLVEAPKEPTPPAEEKLEEPTPHVEAEEVPKERPLGCSHYFGYLRKLPKNALIPDECYGCRRMVECYVQRQI